MIYPVGVEYSPCVSDLSIEHVQSGSVKEESVQEIDKIYQELSLRIRGLLPHQKDAFRMHMIEQAGKIIEGLEQAPYFEIPADQICREVCAALLPIERAVDTFLSGRVEYEQGKEQEDLALNTFADKLSASRRLNFDPLIKPAIVGAATGVVGGAVYQGFWAQSLGAKAQKAARTYEATYWKYQKAVAQYAGKAVWGEAAAAKNLTAYKIILREMYGARAGSLFDIAIPVAEKAEERARQILTAAATEARVATLSAGEQAAKVASERKGLLLRDIFIKSAESPGLGEALVTKTDAKVALNYARAKVIQSSAQAVAAKSFPTFAKAMTLGVGVVSGLGILVAAVVNLLLSPTEAY